MKIKKIKGFTLVELIIAVAISSIILLAIMMMSKPVNDLATVAITYDTQRTIANEINNYVCQSVKYATAVDIYVGYDELPSNAISDFKVNCNNATNNMGIDNSDIKVIAIINDFSGIKISTISGDSAPNKYNGVVTPTDYGRIFKSKEINEHTNEVTYYTAMGKWFYGNEKYQFEFGYGTEGDTGDPNDFNGVINIKTYTYEKGNSEALSAKKTTRLLNFNSNVYSNVFSLHKNSGANIYIVYT